MKIVLYISLGCLVPSLMSGCGEREGSVPQDSLAETPSSSDSDSATQQTGPSTTDTDSEPQLLEGRWGMLVSGATKQVGLPLIKTSMVSSDSFFLVEARLTAPGTITTSETLCGTYMRSDTPLFKSIVPKAFVEHADAVERVIEVGEGVVGSPWVSDNACSVYGARLENPATDPLPHSVVPGSEAAACEDVEYGQACDQDEDGHPGVTFVTSGGVECKLFLGSRICGGLDGTVVDEQHIEGPLWASGDESSLLGASTALCRSMTMKNVSVFEKCKELFYFKLVRLPDEATCADVLAETACDEGHPACVGQTDLPLNPRDIQLGDCD